MFYASLGSNSMIHILVYGGKLFFYNESNNFWTEIGFINNIFKDIDIDVKGGVRCSKGFHYFFKGSI